MENCEEKSLITSENGCKIPIIPTFIGPIRICDKDRTFRSSKVIKATFINKGIIKTK